MVKGNQVPVFIYDGDCSVCSKLIYFLQNRTLNDFKAYPYQSIDLRIFKLSEDECRKEAKWVSDDMRIYGGAHAISKSLRNTGIAQDKIFAILIDFKLFRPFAFFIYKLFARLRFRVKIGGSVCSLESKRF
jgi:predicted DCC family thiol-disulfide oxidoreductase YuxK